MAAPAHKTVDRSTLVARSLQVIEEGQTPEGAYLACSAFANYRYCWFRDGAFIAEAMDEWGRGESAAAFHRWALRTVAAQAATLELADHGADLPRERMLHTRYRADGTPGSDEWPNFQLDGFGTWLWAYARHLSRSQGRPRGEERAALRFVADYLVALWPRANFDCWEEHGEEIHPSTLGAIYAGLAGAAAVLDEPAYAGAALAVRSFLLAHGVRGGRFTKHLGSDEVDANLLWLAVPYEVVTPGHPLAQATVAEIRERLLDPEGGLHRYRGDTYYGGGSWLLLSAALGRYHLEVGERDEAERLLRWIEAQATAEGHFPEQTARYLNDPARLPEWQRRWGESACPLLWSHAAYLSLVRRLEEA